MSMNVVATNSFSVNLIARLKLRKVSSVLCPFLNPNWSVLSDPASLYVPFILLNIIFSSTQEQTEWRLNGRSLTKSYPCSYLLAIYLNLPLSTVLIMIKMWWSSDDHQMWWSRVFVALFSTNCCHVSFYIFQYLKRKRFVNFYMLSHTCWLRLLNAVALHVIIASLQTYLFFSSWSVADSSKVQFVLPLSFSV